jgi:hypothetical protein
LQLAESTWVLGGQHCVSYSKKQPSIGKNVRADVTKLLQLYNVAAVTAFKATVNALVWCLHCLGNDVDDFLAVKLVAGAVLKLNRKLYAGSALACRGSSTALRSM